jgi:hypothetical protein
MLFELQKQRNKYVRIHPPFEFLKRLLTSLSSLLCLEWVDSSVGSLFGTCKRWVRVDTCMYTLDQQFSKFKKWILFLDGWLPKNCRTGFDP